jgi:hypothetical protein
VKILTLAILAVLPFLTANALADESHASALAAVARRLGFTYAYLPQSDEVSLTGHGVAVIVRPGVPFFTVNERVEPVDGEAPRYLDGDLYISPGLVSELTSIARSAAMTYHMRPEPGATNPAHINVAAAGAPPAKVTALELAGVAGSDDVAVTGEATPGALVAIVLTSISDPLLPRIYLNRSFAVARKDGSFSIDIPTAPQYFTGATIVAEASGIDDDRPMIAHYSPPGK